MITWYLAPKEKETRWPRITVESSAEYNSATTESQIVFNSNIDTESGRGGKVHVHKDNKRDITQYINVENPEWEKP